MDPKLALDSNHARARMMRHLDLSLFLPLLRRRSRSQPRRIRARNTEFRPRRHEHRLPVTIVGEPRVGRSGTVAVVAVLLLLEMVAVVVAADLCAVVALRPGVVGGHGVGLGGAEAEGEFGPGLGVAVVAGRSGSRRRGSGVGEESGHVQGEFGHGAEGEQALLRFWSVALRFDVRWS